MSHRPIPKLLTEATEIQLMVIKLRQETCIGVDTEFIRETSFYPRVALIQVATDDEVWLLDPTVLDVSALEPFLKVLTDPTILKIFHASHADQECLFWTYQLVAEPVLDTSIAAALCGMGESIGLQKLVREVLGIHLSKGRARAKWLNRPLSSELLYYAEQDVLHLVKLAKALEERLQKLSRWDWALEESKTDPSRFNISSEEVAGKLARGAHLDKELGVLEELVAWREERAKEANLPRGWIADNEVLIALARAKPQKIEDLKTFRGIHPKEIERSGKTILQAIAKGRAKSPQQVTISEKRLEKIDPHAVDLLEAFVKYLATQNEIMPRFLMSQHQFYQILLRSDSPIETWVREGVLSERAAILVGSQLKSFLGGHLTLQIKDKRLHCLSLKPRLTEE